MSYPVGGLIVKRKKGGGIFRIYARALSIEASMEYISTRIITSPSPLLAPLEEVGLKLCLA